MLGEGRYSVRMNEAGKHLDMLGGVATFVVLAKKLGVEESENADLTDPEKKTLIRWKTFLFVQNIKKFIQSTSELSKDADQS